MKSALDMIQDGYNVINVPAITSLLDGRVYQMERPLNSLKRDIVINAISLTNEQFQQGVFNVNIHCPNLQDVVIDGKADTTQPDLASFRTISAAVLNLLKNVTNSDNHFAAQVNAIPIKDTDGSWYLNIRVSYYSPQLNYTNI